MLEYIGIILLIGVIIFTTFDFRSVFLSIEEQYESIKETLGRVPTMTYVTGGLLIVAVILGFLVSLPK
jgi:hypothetical protein